MLVDREKYLSDHYLIDVRGMRHDYMFRDVYGELKSEHKMN